MVSSPSVEIDRVEAEFISDICSEKGVCYYWTLYCIISIHFIVDVLSGFVECICSVHSFTTFFPF